MIFRRVRSKTKDKPNDGNVSIGIDISDEANLVHIAVAIGLPKCHQYFWLRARAGCTLLLAMKLDAAEK
jgi:hypothetical protein